MARSSGRTPKFRFKADRRGMAYLMQDMYMGALGEEIERASKDFARIADTRIPATLDGIPVKSKHVVEFKYANRHRKRRYIGVVTLMHSQPWKKVGNWNVTHAPIQRTFYSLPSNAGITKRDYS